MAKKSFIVRLENSEQLNMLTDEQAGKLFKGLLAYAQTGEPLESDDRLLLLAFSVWKGQLDRDAEKYEETCRKRSESGKKGGAPIGNQNAAKTSKTSKNKQKQTKQPDTECECVCECDPVPKPEPVPECECVPEPERAPAGSHTAHTTRSGMITLPGIQALAAQLGFVWDEAEAQEFLAYNIDKGRKANWGFAVRKWEENRRKRRKASGAAASASPSELAGMDEYMALVNRFKEDENNDRK